MLLLGLEELLLGLEDWSGLGELLLGMEGCYWGWISCSWLEGCS